jgi:glycosyltransferase involved in cell wall biosynthesis
VQVVKSISPQPKEICDDEHKDIDVLWVGNSGKNKCLPLLYAVARELPECRMAVACIKNDASAYAEFAREAEELPGVNFLGAVSPEKMPELYARARVLFNCSYYEGFPNAFMQAWQGRAVVVSARVDPNGILSQDGLGVLLGLSATPPSSADEWRQQGQQAAEVISGLLTEHTERNAIADKALTYVRQTHAPEVVVDSLVRALQEDNNG